MWCGATGILANTNWRFSIVDEANEDALTRNMHLQRKMGPDGYATSILRSNLASANDCLVYAFHTGAVRHTPSHQGAQKD
ncbi:unnamed protein product [Calypogeia fissa]